MGLEQSLSRLTQVMRQAGITRVANITGLDNVGIPVTLVVRPNSRSLAVSQGKGMTLPLAKISGIMESLEQFHAETIELPLRLSTARELRRTRVVVDTDRLPRTKRSFDEDTRILWVTAVDIQSRQSVEVPFELVHLDMTEPLPEGSGYFTLGSNGLASGDAVVDAIAHGLWELVERDAIALFYERSAQVQSLRRVRLDSVVDPSCRALLRRLQRAPLGVAVWDMTTDLGVAAFLCSIGEREVDPLRRVGMARGYGCHPDRAVALRRAITEAAQSRLTRIAGARDDIQSEDMQAIRSVEAIERHVAHVEQEQYASRIFDEVPSASFVTTREALEFTIERLVSAGFRQILYVDLSREEFPIHVVRVLVPGLEGFPGGADYLPGARVRSLLEGFGPC